MESIKGVVHIEMLNEPDYPPGTMRMEYVSGDVEIHHGTLTNITIDKDMNTFTVTFKPE